MKYDVAVLGAGMVGVASAIHLQRRGLSVVLVDRREPGLETSFGNAGIIQREAVRPYACPRAPGEVLSVLGNRRLDVRYHPADMPALAPRLMRYYRNSATGRYAEICDAYASLTALALDTHATLLRDTEADALIERRGFLMLMRTAVRRDEAFIEADEVAERFGVTHRKLDGAELAALEPGLAGRHAGAVHWTQPWTVRDPGALVRAYAQLFLREGGRFVHGDAATLRRGANWEVATFEGDALRADRAVIALGPWSPSLTRRFGYAPSLFVKRGYHMHYAPLPERRLGHWILDAERGYLIAPMQRGVRLTTGAELAAIESPATPLQLDAAERVARQVFPLGERVDEMPWKGNRPCMADMLPVIGELPGHAGLWAAFGHGHQGFTLGPATGELLAAAMQGERTAVDITPFAVRR
ncbi:NAD(P)/FAD-dependent oxidoreductase [Chitinasiproducens palmae]|uniref:D-amino-acid dehydrogenase n=1 Tax=Chitinasiproducens palmae TaxID=1770053 RepID=A0A1H2PMA1_9BURK|nr:FAD-dependent oxidoreductase [Chitinasiproducens palmae]SDV46847.1 D-amino-acid dehydrogenase [Chitinasiproducens palmae]